MLNIPVKKNIPLIISAFDSINYLLTSEELFRLFKEIKRILSVDGIFTFDVSLEANSICNEKHLNRKGKVDGIKYKQNSEYDTVSKIHKNEFELVLKDGTKKYETHIQKIYDFNHYFEVINECGLYVRDCFDAFTFNDANEKSERIQFIVKQPE